MHHKKYAFYLTIGALLAFGLLVATIIQNPFGAFESDEPLKVVEDKGTQKPIKVDQEVIGQSGSTIYVDCQGGSDTNDGSFWNLAKKTLANAIESASGPTDIFLKANDACYYPGFITITKSDLIISGGYTGNLQNPQERYGDKNSVISSNNSGHVLRVFNLNGKIVFDRLTVRGGNSPYSPGGGFSITNGAPQVTIQNSIIENNYSGHDGGGISVSTGGTFVLNKSILRSNTSSRKGGGLYVISSRYKVFQCQFIENIAQEGGGVAVKGGAWEDFITGSDFIGNRAVSTDTYKGGGGIYVDYSNASIQGNFFKGNTANYGSAFNYWTTIGTNNHYEFSNNIFVENEANYATMFIGKGGFGLKLNNNLFVANKSSLGPLAIMVGDGAQSILIHASGFFNHTQPRPLIGRDSNPQSSYTNYANTVFPQRTKDLIFDDPNQPTHSLLYNDPRFLSTSFANDPFSYEFLPNYDSKDYGANDYTLYDFRGCPRNVTSSGSNNRPDHSAFEYQNVEQYAVLDSWKGPQNDGDQSVVKLTITVTDAGGAVILPPTARAMSSNGYYTIPTRYKGIPANTNVKTIIKAPGYLSASVSGALPACNSPGVNVQLIMGDVDGNNQIDLKDISEILVNFAKSGALGTLPQDLNGNGVVDINDLNATLTNFAKVGAH